MRTILDLTEYMSSFGLPRVQIRDLVGIYEIAQPGKPIPLVKDHRKSKNPYLSRYGEIFLDNLNNTSSMSNCICINDMVIFMVKERDNIMKGSVHEDDFLKCTMYCDS